MPDTVCCQANAFLFLKLHLTLIFYLYTSVLWQIVIFRLQWCQVWVFDWTLMLPVLFTVFTSFQPNVWSIEECKTESSLIRTNIMTTWLSARSWSVFTYLSNCHSLNTNLINLLLKDYPKILCKSCALLMFPFSSP